MTEHHTAPVQTVGSFQVPVKQSAGFACEIGPNDNIAELKWIDTCVSRSLLIKGTSRPHLEGQCCRFLSISTFLPVPVLKRIQSHNVPKQSDGQAHG